MKIPHYSKIHNRFKINGHHYDQGDLTHAAYSFIKEGESFEEVIGVFLLDWLDTSETIEVQTSGTTGNPKKIKLAKQAMVNSAVRTGEYFDLKVGAKALHCLPVNYIAGKMMLVRAMILGLDLYIVEPKINIEWPQSSFDFCAMIPLQAKSALSNLAAIKTLLIGGAHISSSLRKALLDVPTNVFETYGMTETITHIAVASIQESTATFEVLPDIQITADQDGCLVINAPHLSQESIHTQDIVALQGKGAFQLMGRKNNVVNSAGKKFFPEQLEKQLVSLESPSFFAGISDSELGQKLVLVVESSSLKENEIKEFILSDLGPETNRYVKEIYTLEAFCYTPTGKIDRPSTIALV